MPTNPLASIEAYEALIYSLPDVFPHIRISTLVVASIGPVTAVVRGEVHFGQGLYLRVLEVVNFRQRRIERYGYELWKGNEELWWYDSWPHPDLPELRSTDPHHKHIPPDIKHHRVPAPGIGFAAPNLPLLMREVEQEHLSK
ncbi:MAG: hypothetical protein CVU38_08245 [Chloroflexi bacterium HGW-Chloroflexi-1]|nr:MAG: hypothetical protein CVU38_08245 [Chloroflexi bacterium HGW-Chloroflexi-1]